MKIEIKSFIILANIAEAFVLTNNKVVVAKSQILKFFNEIFYIIAADFFL